MLQIPLPKKHKICLRKGNIFTSCLIVRPQQSPVLTFYSNADCGLEKGDVGINSPFPKLSPPQSDFSTARDAYLNSFPNSPSWSWERHKAASRTGELPKRVQYLNRNESRKVTLNGEYVTARCHRKLTASGVREEKLVGV